MTIAEKIAARKALGMTSAEYNAHLAAEAAPKVSTLHHEMIQALKSDNIRAIRAIMDRTGR